MTKVQNPIIGRSRGSAGGMTFAKVYNKNVMKAKIFEATNPNTAAQQTQRNFFKEVQKVLRTVSDAQLRSLFGTMPKGMSRRNALAKQIAAAYTIADGVKTVDFDKLTSIGSGKKVNTNFIVGVNYDDDFGDIFTPDMLNVENPSACNLIFVCCNTTTNQIFIVNSPYMGNTDFSENSLEEIGVPEGIYNYYITCAEDGSNVFSKSFGSFIVKTRKVS